MAVTVQLCNLVRVVLLVLVDSYAECFVGDKLVRVDLVPARWTDSLIQNLLSDAWTRVRISWGGLADYNMAHLRCYMYR